jgi:hypothetical protein
MNFAKPLYLTAALASLTLTACIGAAGEVEGPTGEAQEPSLVSNSLVSNSLVSNSLVSNSLVSNSLVSNALTSEQLATSDLVNAALTDPNSREVFKYIVSCALPNGEHIHVKSGNNHYNFEGSVGLAPEWGEPGGSCNGDCQQWVSACLLARVDYAGQKEMISMRGQDSALSTTIGERFAFPVREATYFGNVFQQPQLRYACLPPGKTEIPRVCGPSLNGCVVNVVGTCDHVCGPVQLDGSYPNCRVGGGQDQTTTTYHGSITVFLQP